MTSLDFAPHLPLALLWVLGGVCILILAYGFYAHARGTWARLLAFAILLFALAGPVIVHETHAPLRDVAVLVVDRSQSMGIGARTRQVDAALAKLRKELAAQKNLEVREAVVTTSMHGEDNGTRAFAALRAALGDVPPGRVAGAIMLTDGEVHDAPPADRMSLHAPLQVLIAGAKNERDRRLSIIDASRFTIVGKKADIVLRVDDLGAAPPKVSESFATVTLRIDGKDAGSRAVPVGKNTPIEIPITHEGENVVEVAAAPGPAELTLQNNHAVIPISGVRDRLRVLLISGEPHAGERVWRDLLKADPSVDLVHFTILRPPEKQDATPIDELSLIAFPTRELFSEKLHSFDLVIFDRYSERGILPLIYYQNLADYVQDGGALLLAVGPEFAAPDSIYRTPLAAVLPARPTGEVVTKGFRPLVTAAGLAHPVTQDLPGGNTAATPPSWGRWFRLIGAAKLSGTTVMSGPDDKPLLVLDKAGKGRVAELLSDQAWLWARGYEGGGPQGELLRRLAHWLMKEPQLEAESLSAQIVGDEIRITRHTMAADAPPVTLTMPSGKTIHVSLSKSEPGIWHGSARIAELGLYHLSDGTLSAVAAAGPLNPKEVADMRATDAILAPLAKASGGSVHWLRDGTPAIRRVGPDAGAAGSGWIGLRSNGAYRVTAAEQHNLLPQWAWLALILASLALAWKIEGR
jgi:hypothetical protein